VQVPGTTRKGGSPGFKTHLAPSTDPSQCDLECGPKVIPWRGLRAGPRDHPRATTHQTVLKSIHKTIFAVQVFGFVRFQGIWEYILGRQNCYPFGSSAVYGQNTEL
jgi:hypothetical protein